MTLAKLMSESTRADRIYSAIAFGVVALVVVLLWAIETPTIARFGHDCFIFLDGAYRIHRGQVIHTDFHSALGPFTPWLFAMAMKITGPNVRCLLVGISLFVVPTSIWAWAVGRQRVAPALNALLVVLVAGTGFGLSTLSFEFYETSFASVFNRFGYAWLVIVAIECLVAPRPSATRLSLVLTGVSTGFAGAALFFVKPSYVAPAVLFFLMGIGVVSRSKDRALGVVLGVVVGLVAFGAIFRFHYLAFLSDYFDAADVRANYVNKGSGASLFVKMLRRDSFSMTSGKLLEIFRLEFLPNLMLLTGAFVVPARTSALMADYARRRTVVVLALLTIASGFPIVFSNWQWSEVPTTAAFGIALVEYARRALPDDAASAETSPWRLMAATWLAVVLVGPHVARDVGSVVFALAERGPSSSLGTIDAPATRGLRILASDGYCRPRAYAERIEGGMKLLQPLTAGGRPRVLVFDFSNPFTFTMQLEPPRGTLMWWHVGASFDRQVAPSGRDVFREVDAVMLSKCPEDAPTSIDMQELYKEELVTLFQIHAEDRDWILLTRRDPL